MTKHTFFAFLAAFSLSMSLLEAQEPTSETPQENDNGDGTVQVQQQVIFVPTAGKQWREVLHRTANRDAWKTAPGAGLEVDADALDEAIEAARAYFLNAQYTDGNFRYGLDITNNEVSDSDNQVRQAGALWGLSNLNRHRFTEPTRRAVMLGLDFFIRNMRQPPNGMPKVITYKGGRNVKTGTIALFCLAITDFLEGQERYLSEAQCRPYLEVLESNLRFLQSQEMEDGSWREEFDCDNAMDGNLCPTSSPYYDGESLLAYLYALKYYSKRPKLTPPAGLAERVEFALPQLIRKYAVDALLPGGDYELAKGFCQWGMMSFALYCQAHEGALADAAADAALTLAWWQIFSNSVESKSGNTAYAVEGLLATWSIAVARQMDTTAEVLRQTILRILANLMVCQIGGPYEEHNPYLKFWSHNMPQRAQGGIISGVSYGFIRIDNVQHQVHAMLMARRLLFSED